MPIIYQSGRRLANYLPISLCCLGLYKKNIEREEEHQEITSNESDTDDEDTNDTHEEQGVTVTTTTDHRNLHLSRVEVTPRYNDLLQKVRKVVKLFKRSSTKCWDNYIINPFSLTI
ncbi:hypothetical protein AVEN_46634-1 [Araneus ventricosus]|uniref:Uncharacterized protein n=1 Tax=Araneus ventricosus TaxID=182803 RepID=A0A4Y2TMU6_ARAVE|nr:hypothetical protein AVEN_46634-1 [Araneus ventricosus]